MDLLRRSEAFIPSRIMFMLTATAARADLYMFCVIMPSFRLPFSSCQAVLLKSIILFYACVRARCVSVLWCKHNIRRDFYCNVSVWCQLSWAASCLEKRMTVWLFDDNARLASLFLLSASLKSADIKCLMLACTTDVQIKSSPVGRSFVFFFLPAFWQCMCVFCCKSLDCFISPSWTKQPQRWRSENGKLAQDCLWMQE